MNHLRMCESVDTRLSIATPAFQHPRIIKSPPESLGTRLGLAIQLVLQNSTQDTLVYSGYPCYSKVASTKNSVWVCIAPAHSACLVHRCPGLPGARDPQWQLGTLLLSVCEWVCECGCVSVCYHLFHSQIPLPVSELNDEDHPVTVGISDALYIDTVRNQS